MPKVPVGNRKSGRTIQISILIVATIGLLIAFLTFYFTFIAPSTESQPISIKENIDKISTFDKLIDIDSLSFDRNCDSIESLELTRSSNDVGTILTFTIKFEDSYINNKRKISVLLIDSNNYVRMIYPSLDVYDINNIIDGNSTFQSVIENEPNNFIYTDKKIEIKFITSAPNFIISNGEWRVVAIFWKQQYNNNYNPSLIVSEKIPFEEFKKSATFLELLAFFFSILLSIFGGLLLAYYSYKKGVSKVK